MIVLWQFKPALGLLNPSPFCMKVETWLRLSGLAYETRSAFSPGKGPLGKLPFVEDAGERIPDSTRIIEVLSARHGVDLDASLDEARRGLAHGIRRLVEEHLYWCLLCSRWLDQASWPATKAALFGSLPAGLRDVVAVLGRRKIARDARGHGLALHDRNEIYRRGAADVAALSALLGGQAHMMGAEATSVDATVYAFLASIWQPPLESSLKTAVGSHPNLVAYCARLQQRCFP